MRSFISPNHPTPPTPTTHTHFHPPLTSSLSDLDPSCCVCGRKRETEVNRSLGNGFIYWLMLVFPNERKSRRQSSVRARGRLKSTNFSLSLILLGQFLLCLHLVLTDLDVFIGSISRCLCACLCFGVRVYLCVYACVYVRVCAFHAAVNLLADMLVQKGNSRFGTH